MTKERKKNNMVQIKKDFSKLNSYDIRLIALKHKKGTSLVYKVLRGDRNNVAIIVTATLVLDKKEELEKLILN